jgi:hypothetical protein
MSTRLVAGAAANRAAFDPTPPPDSLHVCHVPFERLTGVGELETQVTRRIAAYDRIALHGPIGCGKSSVARYALREWEGPLAPIWINVATEDHAEVATVRGFLSILVSQLAARAARAEAISDERRREFMARSQSGEPLGSIDTKTGGEIGGSYWLLTAGLSREVSRTVPLGTAYRDTEELRQAARDVLAVLAEGERVPVLVCDDADRLLSVPGAAPDSDDLFRGFFGEVLRELAENLECALVVATQESYTARDDYFDVTAGVIDRLDIPALSEPGQLREIISARVEFVESSASADDLVTADAIDLLHDLHLTEHARSLRKTLTILRAALSLAAGNGADLVRRSHVEAAAA